MTAWGIVVAAGRGDRFGDPKHVQEISGKELWQWAEESLRKGGVDETVVVGDVPGGIPGGRRRRDSVWCGLEQVPAYVDYVLVHDAARPLASSQLTAAVLARLLEGEAEGVVPAVGVRDALKRVEDDVVVGSVDRAQLVAVQTPQGFVADALRRAHSEVAAVTDAADDSELVAAIGGRVVTIPGESANLKVTFPADLRWARDAVS